MPRSMEIPPLPSEISPSVNTSLGDCPKLEGLKGTPLMIDHGKQNLLGVTIDAVDYDAAVNRIRDAAREERPYGVSALAVHGVMTGVTDEDHRHRLNQLELVTPDGQPVRWALRLLHGVKLPDRVYGPELMLRTCTMARDERLPIYLYGSTVEVLESLAKNLTQMFPGIDIAGFEPSKFRQTTAEEKVEISQRIKDSGAKITFIGLGCPRQEVFAYEYRNELSMPMLAVGAAFDYHAGLLEQPPAFIQRAGLQWLYRLVQEPRRLWHRYTVLNAQYLSRVALQKTGRWSPDPAATVAPREEVLYG